MDKLYKQLREFSKPYHIVLVTAQQLRRDYPVRPLPNNGVIIIDYISRI